MTPSLDALRERTRTWTEPIRAEAPAGLSAKHEPAYEFVTQEVARLESPAGAPVRWAQVVSQAGELLQRHTKDLWLTSYLAHGLHATEGLGGAVMGVTVLTEVLERYWTTLYPESQRPRGRVNALNWFVARMTQSLPSLQVSGEDRELVEGLHDAASRLAEVSQARFGDSAPPLKPLLEGVERLRARLPTAPLAPAAPRAAPVSPAPPPLASGASGEQVLDTLRGLGASLVESARVLREANALDPSAYRLLRVGLWLHLAQAPVPGAEGRTPVPALPGAVRERLERLEAHARWAELLEEAESALVTHRLVLDLQRHAATALAGLGPAQAAAHSAVLLEVRALLGRMPTLPELLAADGTPLADERTRKWVEDEVRERAPPRAPTARAVEAPEESEAQAALPPEVRELLARDRTAEALAWLQNQAALATTGRSRFKGRLLLSRLCVLSGQHVMAQALYETLVTESTSRGLDDWEPRLSAECLEGLLLMTRTVRRNTPFPTPDSWPHFIRLSKLDPAAAFRLGPS